MPERIQSAPERQSANLPIENLSVRARGVLRRLGIEETEDLARLSEDVLRQTRNCGQKTVREIGAWHESLKSALRAPRDFPHRYRDSPPGRACNHVV